MQINGWVQIADYAGPRLIPSPINRWGKIVKRHPRSKPDSRIVRFQASCGPHELQVTDIYLWSGKPPEWLIDLDRPKDD